MHIRRPTGRRVRLDALPVCLFLLATTAGCAVKIPKVDLYPLPAEPREVPQAATLGLVPLDDQRPENQREGERPGLWIFLLYNQRIGTYLTGDQHFEGPHSDTISRALTDALDGERFGRVRLLDVEPSRSVTRGLELCRSEGLRYVGLGSIESLYGTIDQRAYFAILPIPFVALIGFSNATSDPLGVVQLDLEILECATRETVYRRKILRQLRYPEESPSQAVRLALFDILEQVRNEASPR